MTLTHHQTMPGAYVDASGELAIRALPVPSPTRGTALLRTIVSTVCGSDLHRFRGADSYGFDTDAFGHETVGEVVDCPCGEFDIGTRVLHVPFPADGKVFAPYQLAHVGQLVALPADLAPDSAVFAQQLGTVVYALRQYWPSAEPPDGALVVGAGPAGVMFVQLLRHLGSEQVWVVEPDANRRALAERFGARVVEQGESVGPENAVSLAIDTSGELDGRARCGRAVRNGGVVGIFGLPDDEPGDLGIPVLDILGRNMRIAGAMGAQGEVALASFRMAVDLIASGAIDVSPLVSHRGTLDDLVALCEKATHVADDVVKVLVRFDEVPATMNVADLIGAMS